MLTTNMTKPCAKIIYSKLKSSICVFVFYFIIFQIVPTCMLVRNNKMSAKTGAVFLFFHAHAADCVAASHNILFIPPLGAAKGKIF